MDNKTLRCKIWILKRVPYAAEEGIYTYVLLDSMPDAMGLRCVGSHGTVLAVKVCRNLNLLVFRGRRRYLVDVAAVNYSGAHRRANNALVRSGLVHVGALPHSHTHEKIILYA